MSNIKEACYWYEDGILVKSFSADVCVNWKCAWVEKNGSVMRKVYFHKTIGGTFLTLPQ